MRELAEAHRITPEGVFRTLALGVAANRSTSSAREVVAEIVAQVIADIKAKGKFRPQLKDAVGAVSARLRAASTA